jgi:hypothetical protein
MALNPTQFNHTEGLVVSGKAMAVAGIVQYEAADGRIVTRYQLTGSGTSLVLQEDRGNLALLRPFPPAAAPAAEGNTVSVMGEKYTLGGVNKLKVLGAVGDPPGGVPKAPLLLSAQFDGNMGVLLRELVPGKPEQTYYLVKPFKRDEILTGPELEKRIEAERVAAEAAAEHEEAGSTGESGGWLAKLGTWAVMILVVGGLAYACSDDDDSYGHSVRVGTGSHGHGGK